MLPLLAAVLLWLWDAWLWRLPGLQSAAHRPRLDGLWRVTYHPTADSHIPEGGSRGPITGYFVIRQSFWFVTVRSYTKQSTSDSRSFYWDLRPGNDVSTLTFTYENSPKESETHRSMRHFGTSQLDPTSLQPKEIVGRYFTDRYTKGDLSAELISRTTGHASFESAALHAAGQTTRSKIVDENAGQLVD
ncbi:Cap15 family cyclic dinucleotide receptor domain-containing protein [Microterricola pindariensis]